MPLISIWKTNPEAVSQLNIEQVVSAAGDGNLRDHSECSDELRHFLSEVPTASIMTYIDHCLTNAYKQGGMVLQDLVNEVGRRLDYEVENGRYQGVTNAIGFDGIWRTSDSNDLVVEVKTTDSYRISLNTIAGYRNKLIAADKIDDQSSVLIVVGRNDTGELEAQIRGSRHAWDMRVISAEALLKLLQVKENSSEETTGTKIRSLFTPVEYTRLDGMVDVVFTAATDSEVVPEAALDEPQAIGAKEQSTKGTWQFTDSALLHSKRLQIVEKLSTLNSTHLLQKTRAQYWNASREIRAVCSLSKRYQGKNQSPYWYAYHPQWDEFLADAEMGFLVLGCMDLDRAFAIPRSEIVPLLPKLNQTVRETGAYWHIHLTQSADGLAIAIPNSPKPFSIEKFAFPVA